jgi:hypothetical protein
MGPRERSFERRAATPSAVLADPPGLYVPLFAVTSMTSNGASFYAILDHIACWH